MHLGLQIGANLILADTDVFQQWWHHRNAVGLPIGVLTLILFLIRRMTRGAAPNSASTSSGRSGTPSAWRLISLVSILCVVGLISLVVKTTSPGARQAGMNHLAERPEGAPANPGQPRGQSAPVSAANTTAGFKGISSDQAGSMTRGEDRRAVTLPAGAASEDLQDPKDLSIGAGSPPASRPAHFSIGSSRAEVIAVQGKPDSQSDRMLVYGLSRVLLDEAGNVRAWANTSNNLIVK
jgi:hypothetical protein